MTTASLGPSSSSDQPLSEKAVAGRPFLRLSNVSKTFGGVRALVDVDFAVGRGEVHCLAGENGSGKSTLIKIATGVHAADEGASIEIAGVGLDPPTPALARRLGVAVIWQDLALFPEMTVAENIAAEALVGPPRLVRRGRLRETARVALARLGVTLALDAPLRELPIAERQIVAIARALASEARLVFMDEPTASLTQSETDFLIEAVRRLSADGVGVVFVSHRLAEVLEIASRVTVLRDGRLVGVYPTEGMTQSRLTELMTGRTFDQAVVARDLSAAPAVLETRGLTRRGEFEDIDLVVRRGEIVGLIGLIGAGRTELGHALFGMTRPDRGEILLDGKAVRFRSNGEAIAAGVAYVPEDRLALGLVQAQSIADNTALTVLERLEVAGLLSPRRQRELVERRVGELGIRFGALGDPVATLSGGNQQRVVLAKWLATEPRLLICDAPTVGVDVGARAGIFEIVRALAADGLAILLISDEAPEVWFNSDRVLHMADGRIVAELDPRQGSFEALERAVHA